MASLAEDIAVQRFSASSPKDRREVVKKFAVLTQQAAEDGIDPRPRLWRLAQAAYPESQALWNLFGELESFSELENEQQIDALYEHLADDPDDAEAMIRLRALQAQEAERLVQALRDSLPAKPGELSHMLAEARKQLDADFADDDSH
jgi:hypothetical protein